MFEHPPRDGTGAETQGPRAKTGRPQPRAKPPLSREERTFWDGTEYLRQLDTVEGYQQTQGVAVIECGHEWSK